MSERHGENICGHGPRLIPVLCKHGKEIPQKITVGRNETKQIPIITHTLSNHKVSGSKPDSARQLAWVLNVAGNIPMVFVTSLRLFGFHGVPTATITII